MDSLLNLISGQLSGSTLSTLARQVGADPEATSKAVSTALPMLVGALARNAQKPEGAAALAGALDRDHDGSILNDLGGFLSGGSAATAGDAILRHVLGGRQTSVVSGLSQTTGLDTSLIGKLLPLLAPIVLGALGKAKREEGLDARALAGKLGGERKQAENGMPQLGGLLQMLDADGDGDVTKEVIGLGSKLFGMFARKR